MNQLRQQPVVADTETIGGLFARLVDEAKQFARAEIDYYRVLTVSRIAGLKTAVGLILFALFLLQASLTTLLVGIGLGIAHLVEKVGLAGGVVLSAVIGLAISGILVWIALRKIAAAGEAAK